MTEKIHEQALEAAKKFKYAEAALIRALMEVNRARVYLELGYSSLFTYCTQALGLSEAVSYTAIAVARKSQEIPALERAVQEGLGLSKAKKIVSVLKAEDAGDWIEKAKTLSSRKLEKAVAEVSPRTGTVERASYVTGDRLSLSLGVSEKLILELRRAQDQVSRSKGTSASLEETLEVLVQFYLKKRDPVEKAKRVIAKKGSKLVTGTVATDPIPTAHLHAVRLRDQGRCQKPGCRETRWIDTHHVIPLSQGGTHDIKNLTTLCKGHHQAEHLRL